MSHSWSSCNYILPVAAFSILYNIPKFFELTTETHTYIKYAGPTSNKTDSQTQESDAGDNKTFEVGKKKIHKVSD